MFCAVGMCAGIPGWPPEEAVCGQHPPVLPQGLQLHPGSTGGGQHETPRDGDEQLQGKGQPFS